MGYYIRLLSTSPECPAFATLEQALRDRELSATLSLDEGSSGDWLQLTLCHADGREIAIVGRDVVQEGSLAAEELDEFADEIGECKPENAAAWLLDYFSRVRCIYAFQILSGVDHKDGWEILDAVKSPIWSFAPSIQQADGEGFSNEDGYHILWQFDDSVKGDWWMGVLLNGDWHHFEMNLGNRKHRESFWRGEIPDSARLA